MLISILPTLTAYSISLLKKKIAEIESRTRGETVKRYADIAECVIETSVSAVSQIFVDAAKKNGTFDSAAAIEAKETAKQYILSALSNTAKTVLAEIYGDLDKYISNRMEHYVVKSKVESNTLKSNGI